MAIARLVTVALDCEDPQALAAFYSALTGWSIVRDDGDWVELAADGAVTLACQGVAEHRPPRWPSADHPQQVHTDFLVDDLDAGEAAVLAIGARKAEVQPDENFRVFVDPAGHPFCLVRDVPQGSRLP